VAPVEVGASTGAAWFTGAGVMHPAKRSNPISKKNGVVSRTLYLMGEIIPLIKYLLVLFGSYPGHDRC